LKIKRSALLSVIAILLITNIVTLVLWGKGNKSLSGMDAASETVATVGDEVVSREDWLHRLEKKYGEQELKALVNQKVMEKVAKDNGIEISKEQIDQEYELIQSVYNTYDQKMVLDEDAVRKQLKAELMLEEYLTKDVKVKEEDMLSYYEENEKLYQIPTMYKLAQITVLTKEDGDQVITELENGSSFKVLAMEHSVDKQSSALGGEIGYIPVNSGYLSKEAIKELESLDNGEWTNPVAVDDHYVIYRLEEKTKEKHYSFDEVKRQIRRQIALEQLETPVQPEDFWEEVGVEWFYGKKQ
jgi:foldase protein PrsA